MTPLARSLYLGHAEAWDNADNVKAQLHDCQFFEISAVYNVIDQMAEDVAYGASVGHTDDIFLPAEPCWIEFIGPCGQRDAVFLTRKGKDIFGQFCWGKVREGVNAEPPIRMFREMSGGPVVLPMEIAACTANLWDLAKDPRRYELYQRAFWAIALSMINSPRIIGRRQHMPDRKLEAAILSRDRPKSQYPLGAWTEIMLRVTPPKLMHDQPSVEAHLTGRRALHFCRAHLRIRLGRLELVRGHWRGDIALGRRRSRYTVAA